MEGRAIYARYVRTRRGKLLDQFNNPDNLRPLANDHRPGNRRQTPCRITHFVPSMGTTGTITGVSRFALSRKAGDDCRFAAGRGQQYSGYFRRWPAEYMP